MEPRIETSRRFVWTKRVPVGTPEKPTMRRFGATCTLVGHYLWVIGGARLRQSYSVLDLREHRWRFVAIEGRPYRFHLHTANLFEDCLLLFGADIMVGRISVRSTDVVRFDPVLNEVTAIACGGDIDLHPLRKQSHTADVCESEKLLVLFGGIPHPTSPHRNLYLLDLTSWRWTMPKSKGTAPTQRERHASTLVGSRLFIYGGDRGFQNSHARADLHTVVIRRSGPLVWQAVRIYGNPKLRRIFPGFHYVGNGRIVIFGGFSDNRDTSDFLIIEDVLSNRPVCHVITEARNVEYSWRGELPPPRCQHTIIQSQGVLLVIGGTADDGSSYFELRPE